MMTKNRFVILGLLAAFLVSPAHAETKKDSSDVAVLTSDAKPSDKMDSKVLTGAAFNTLKEEMFPASPDEIKEVREIKEKQERALYERPAPKEVSKILSVSTEPGAPPAIVLVTPGRSTTLNVIDSTGQPWPIQAALGGNNADYDINTIEEHQFKNIVRVDAKKDYGSTNVILSLAALSTTVNVEIVSGTDQYYPTPVLQIDKEGPQAKKLPAYGPQPIANDEILKKLVLGIAPQDFKPMKSSDKQVEGWKNKDGEMFIRTALHPISPLPRTIYNGPNGHSAFKINAMPLVICVDDNGIERKVYFND